MTGSALPLVACSPTESAIVTSGRLLRISCRDSECGAPELPAFRVLVPRTKVPRRGDGRRELGRNFHPFRELEAGSPLLGVVNRHAPGRAGATSTGPGVGQSARWLGGLASRVRPPGARGHTGTPWPGRIGPKTGQATAARTRQDANCCCRSTLPEQVPPYGTRPRRKLSMPAKR